MLDEPMNACPKPRPHILDRIAAKRAAEGMKREVYAKVDARDGKRCRCCGRKGNPNATTTIGRLHRAHIQDASRGGQIETANLATLCWICHALEHAKQLWFRGTNADDVRLGFDIHEAAAVEVFGTKPVPRHVHIIAQRRR
jgi:hypothetical protein